MRFGNIPLGEERLKFKFLWFPVWIGSECRWLEKAMWVQSWDKTIGFIDYSYCWSDNRFIDHEQEDLVILKYNHTIHKYDVSYPGQYREVISLIRDYDAEILYGEENLEKHK